MHATARRFGELALRARPLITLIAFAMAAHAGYVVAGGDTLSSIASRHGTTVSALVDANGISDPDRIYAGQELVIPTDAASGAASASAPADGHRDSSTYVVRPGDTLAAIAARNGLTVEQLARANGLDNPNRLLTGTLLRIADAPAPAPGVAGASSATHTVAAGETLSSIATRYGVSVRQLAQDNGLTNPDLIRIGQTLEVPGSATVAWVCPVAGATFVNDFGVAKPDGRRHEGVDLFAPHGTIVRAPVSGVVSHTTGNRAGLQFTLVGDDGYTYLGMHLDSWGEEGRVAAGDPIGQVGNTGNAEFTPPHLHFEMKYGGVVSPYPTLSAYCG